MESIISFLKDICSHLVSPWGVFWAGLITLLFLRKKFPALFRRSLFILLVYLYIMSISPARHLFVHPLEVRSYKMSRNSALSFSEAQAIVVLGGGISIHGIWSPPRLGLDALSRLNHAAKIYHELNEEIPIIFSTGLGKSSKDVPSEGEVAEPYLKQWQVSNYYLENSSGNTYENAIETKRLLEKLGKPLEKPMKNYLASFIIQPP